MFSLQGVFLFLFATGKIQKDLERMEEFRGAFIQRGWKDSERLLLRPVPDEGFPHKKIKTETFVWIMVLQKISQKMYAVKAAWKFDSIELK